MADANVYIASMNMRGKWADAPQSTKLIKLNVTSAQAKNNPNRLDFSPMTGIAGGYKGYFCFENYWQSGKVHEQFDSKSEGWKEIDHETSKTWWKNQLQGKRRYPAKNTRVKHADYGFGPVEYISARKKVYIPEYYALIEDRLLKWKEKISEGYTIVVYDFDGPRSETNEPLCLPVTLDLIKEKIDDPKHPFGHGYIIAAALSDILPSAYIYKIDEDSK